MNFFHRPAVQRIAKMVLGFDRRFHKLLVGHLRRAHGDIHEALKIITQMNNEISIPGWKAGLFVNFAIHDNDFRAAWDDLVKQNDLLLRASRESWLYIESAEKMGHKKLISLLRGKQIITDEAWEKVREMVGEIEKTELDYYDQYVRMLERLRASFLEYEKHAVAVLDAYLTWSKDSSNRFNFDTPPEQTRARWDEYYHRGLKELEKAMELLKRSKHLVIKELREEGPKLAPA